MTQRYRRQITDEDRRTFLKALGIAGTAGVVGEFTLGDLREEVTLETGGELATMGEAIQRDLSGQLDAGLLGTGMAALGAEIERLPELQAAGLPEEVGTAYQDLTDPAWRISEHLAEIGFYASAEKHLPPFVPGHIESTAKQLIRTETLSGVLSDVGFTAEEQTAVVMSVVNNNDHLAKWKPTDAYPPEKVDDFDPADIAPLHQRAADGALLWIDGLDWWLWQNKVLLTEDLLADGIWDIKAMLGGVHLLSQAAHDVARGEIADEDLTAMVTAGSAIAIMGQEHLTNDVVRISDEARAPRGSV